jgi:diguanylate cyclase (GGDEF)-like protein
MTVLELEGESRRWEVGAVTNRRRLDQALGRLDSAEIVVVIRSFGHTLTGALRTSDWAARFGGQEFVVILNDASDPGSFLDRFRASWEGERPHPVTFSAGIAPVKGGPRFALAAADRALYRAKEAGRDCWAWAAEDDYKD